MLRCTLAGALVAAILLVSTPFARAAAQDSHAIVHRSYGPPGVLRLEAVEKPVPRAGEVLVRVRAASVNPLDWHYLRGEPYFLRLVEGAPFRPAVERLGVDLSGVVEAVGADVTRFRPGDEVFGYRYGAFAEYVRTAEKTLVAKPANISFEEAAAVPIAGVSALQALRDAGRLQSGQKVLVNGASGGVGTFAVQIAKALGAEVTGVCSTRNLEMVRALGADRVIDYTREDFTRSGERYDLIIDMVGNHPLPRLRDALAPQGIVVMVGSQDKSLWLGPLVGMLRSAIYSGLVSQEFAGFLATLNREDLEVLATLMREGKLRPVIDTRYALGDTADAIRHVEQGHSRGKVVITVADELAPDPVAAAPAPAGIAPELRAAVVLLALTGVPLALALLLAARERRREPARKPFRWGWYFALQSLAGGAVLGYLLESGVALWAGCALGYALLAWFFIARRRWAWIALTVLSFNPLAWIINFVYLRRRWNETG